MFIQNFEHFFENRIIFFAQQFRLNQLIAHFVVYGEVQVVSYCLSELFGHFFGSLITNPRMKSSSPTKDPQNVLKTKRIIQNFQQNLFSHLNVLPTALTKSTSLTTSPNTIIVVHININNVLSFHWLYAQILYFVLISRNISVVVGSDVYSDWNGLNDVFSELSRVVVADVSDAEFFGCGFVGYDVGDFSSDHFVRLVTDRQPSKYLFKGKI